MDRYKRNANSELRFSTDSSGLQQALVRGQGYDGAAVMSEACRGVQAVIRKELTGALYTRCSSHSLNLC